MTHGGPFTRFAPAVLVGVAIALGACGDGDDGDGEAPTAAPDVATVESAIEEELGGPSIAGDPPAYEVEAVTCPADAVVAPGEEFECEAATSEGDVPVGVSLGSIYTYTGTVGTSAVSGTFSGEPTLAAIERDLTANFADNHPGSEVDCPDDADLEGEFDCDVAPDGEVTVAALVALHWSTTVAGEPINFGPDPLE